MARLLALFVLVPIAELAILIQLGKVVGLLPTLALIVATGIAGAALTRRQGVGALRRVQEELAQGKVPAAALVDGLLILLAGGVLLTPGLLTDVAGFLLLVPATRRRVRALLVRRFERAVRQGRVHVSWSGEPWSRTAGSARETGAREPEWEERPPEP